jgi:hypothetical protein
MMKTKQQTRTKTKHLVFMLTVSLSATLSLSAAPVAIKDVQHVTVRHEKGRCLIAPANGGIWSWGNEILVQYRSGEFQDKPVGSHDINFNKPILIEQSRSFDGGLTWTQHTAVPIQITEPGYTGPAGAKFPEFGPPLKEVPALTTPLGRLSLPLAGSRCDVEGAVSVAVVRHGLVAIAHRLPCGGQEHRAGVLVGVEGRPQAQRKRRHPLQGGKS